MSRLVVGNFALLVLALGTVLPVAAYDVPPGLPYSFDVYLDIDSNAATGGTVFVTQAGDAEPQARFGIDAWVQASATLPPATSWSGASPQVTMTTVRRWEGGSFEVAWVSNDTYPVGRGTGIDSSNVVEIAATLADLGNPEGQIRGLFHASTTVFNDYTDFFSFTLKPSAEPIPVLPPWGLLLFAIFLTLAAVRALRRSRVLGTGLLIAGLGLGVAGVAQALTIGLDGETGDWASTAPIVADQKGDSSASDANEDILFGFVTEDEGHLYFRIDIVNLGDPEPTPTPTPPAPTPTPAG